MNTFAARATSIPVKAAGAREQLPLLKALQKSLKDSVASAILRTPGFGGTRVVLSFDPAAKPAKMKALLLEAGLTITAKPAYRGGTYTLEDAAGNNYHWQIGMGFQWVAVSLKDAL